jgi:hypothetical protein
MECFRDTVGVRYCTPGTPAFRYFINYLPGVSLKQLDKISNEEQKGFLGVWNDIQERALVNMEHQILNHFTSYFKTDLLIQNSQFGQFQETITNDVQENKFKGVYLYGSLYKYLELKIRTITFYSQGPVTDAEFYIYDTVSGALLETITTDLITGYNTIDVDFVKFNGLRDYERLFICYNDANFLGVQTFGQFVNEDLIGDCNSRFSTENFIGNGGTCDNSSQVLTANIQNPSNTYGLSVNFTVGCSLSAYICQFRDKFKHAWIQLLGAEIKNEQLNSDRLNRYTLTESEDSMMEKYTMYMDNFKESLKTVFDNLNIPDDMCFDCNTSSYSTYLMP